MLQMTRNLCTQIGFNTSEFADLDDSSVQYVSLAAAADALPNA